MMEIYKKYFKILMFCFFCSGDGEEIEIEGKQKSIKKEGMC